MDRIKKLYRIEKKIGKELSKKVPINIQPDGLPDEKWVRHTRKLRLLKDISIRLHLKRG